VKLQIGLNKMKPNRILYVSVKRMFNYIGKSAKKMVLLYRQTEQLELFNTGTN